MIVIINPLLLIKCDLDLARICRLVFSHFCKMVSSKTPQRFPLTRTKMDQKVFLKVFPWNFVWCGMQIRLKRRWNHDSIHTGASVAFERQNLSVVKAQKGFRTVIKIKMIAHLQHKNVTFPGDKTINYWVSELATIMMYTFTGPYYSFTESKNNLPVLTVTLFWTLLFSHHWLLNFKKLINMIVSIFSCSKHSVAFAGTEW